MGVPLFWGILPQKLWFPLDFSVQPRKMGALEQLQAYLSTGRKLWCSLGFPRRKPSKRTHTHTLARANTHVLDLQGEMVGKRLIRVFGLGSPSKQTSSSRPMERLVQEFTRFAPLNSPCRLLQGSGNVVHAHRPVPLAKTPGQRPLLGRGPEFVVETARYQALAKRYFCERTLRPNMVTSAMKSILGTVHLCKESYHEILLSAPRTPNTKMSSTVSPGARSASHEARRVQTSFLAALLITNQISLLPIPGYKSPPHGFAS